MLFVYYSLSASRIKKIIKPINNNNKNIVLIVTLFLLLDAADIARFTLSY